MDKKQNEIWNKLCELSGEDVASLFTDYHGVQLLSEGFWEYLQNEGYLEPSAKLNCCENCDECKLSISLGCMHPGLYSNEDENEEEDESGKE